MWQFRRLTFGGEAALRSRMHSNADAFTGLSGDVVLHNGFPTPQADIAFSHTTGKTANGRRIVPLSPILPAFHVIQQ
ncbi:unnamed protein product [Angiostrongylus costaricensis]|uniref:AMP-binding domain-containing protein n=1 Tax=Angiostrongylus costaricensis TaxID=334426 RepID=A0A0R3PMU6_ANGCS|nr:unnamed protein product [Angiostrongylus costaricensis]